MLPRWLVQLLAVALKEVRQTVSDRRMMALLLVAPVIQLGVFGSAVNFDVDRVPTVVVDHDHTAASRAHLEHVLADGTLRRTVETESDAAALAELDAGRAAAALIVPAGFAAALARGEAATLQVVVDGTDPNRGSIAAAAVARYGRVATRELARGAARARAGEGLGASPRADVELVPRVLYNPRLRTSRYVVPGILALLLLVVTVIVTAMGLARERETGTLEQVLVTPIGSTTLLLGKLLPYVLIGLFDFVLGLAVAAWAFDVPIRGSVGVVLLGTLAYVTCSLGIGLLISTVSLTQQQAFIGGFLFMLPALLLSGVLTPLWGIPEWLRPVTLVNPVRHYVEIVRGVLLRGATFSELQVQFAALGATAAAVLTVASWRFKRGWS
jgi:ABC-2 type transport system permease protein